MLGGLGGHVGTEQVWTVARTQGLGHALMARATEINSEEFHTPTRAKSAPCSKEASYDNSVLSASQNLSMLPSLC